MPIALYPDQVLEMRHLADRVAGLDTFETGFAKSIPHWLRTGADSIEALLAARDTVGSYWSASTVRENAYRIESENLRAKLADVHSLMCEALRLLAGMTESGNVDVDEAFNQLALALRRAA